MTYINSIVFTQYCYGHSLNNFVSKIGKKASQRIDIVDSPAIHHNVYTYMDRNHGSFSMDKAYCAGIIG